MKASSPVTKSVIKYLDNQEYYDLENFKRDVKRYVKSIKEQRVICSIENVSKSGMSRQIQFLEFDKRKNRGSLSTFYSIFKALGYQECSNNRGYFRITGCGMDMIFHTNYTICRDLLNMGLITKKTCDKICQMTPRLI